MNLDENPGKRGLFCRAPIRCEVVVEGASERNLSAAHVDRPNRGWRFFFPFFLRTSGYGFTI